MPTTAPDATAIDAANGDIEGIFDAVVADVSATDEAAAAIDQAIDVAGIASEVQDADGIVLDAPDNTQSDLPDTPTFITDADSADVGDSDAPDSGSPDADTAAPVDVPCDTVTPTTPPGCDLSVPLLSVDTTSTGSACPCGCNPPYPCGCDGCAWLPTPEMHKARFNVVGVWSGKEVYAIGGRQSGKGDWEYHLDIERWQPEDVWELIPGPDLAPAGGNLFGVTGAAWAAGFLFVSYQTKTALQTYRFDPAAKTWSGPPELPGSPHGGRPRATAAGVFLDASGFYGFFMLDPVTMKAEALPVPTEAEAGGKATYDCKASGKPFTCSFLDTQCTVSTGSDILIFDAWKKTGVMASKVWPDGTDQKYAHGLRYNVLAKQWSQMPTAPKGIRCLGGGAGYGTVVEGFPDGVFVFAPLDEDYKATNLGAVYWAKTNTWTPISSLGLPSPRWNVNVTWTGKWFATTGGFGKKPFCPWAWGGCGSGHLYDPYADTWQPIPQHGAVMDGRESEMVVSNSQELFVIGGIDGPCCVNVTHKDGRRWRLPKP